MAPPPEMWPLILSSAGTITDRPHRNYRSRFCGTSLTISFSLLVLDAKFLVSNFVVIILKKLMIMIWLYLHIGILETFVICPNCQYDLGPCNSYSTQSSPSLLPLPISEHSYILFEVSFGLTFPFKMGGDCPVIITNILESGGDLTLENIVSREIVGGLCKPRIVDIVGPYANHLVSETSSHGSFTAAVGDIVYKVDEVEVTHLDCLKVKRYLKRKVSERKKEMKMQTPVKPIVVTFRRHFLSKVFSDDKAKFSAEAQAPAVSDNPAVTETENDFHDSSSATGKSPATTTDSHQEGKVSTLHSALGSITTHSPTTDNAHTTDNKTSNDLHPAISPFLTLPTTVAFQQSGNKITDINHTICQVRNPTNGITFTSLKLPALGNLDSVAQMNVLVRCFLPGCYTKGAAIEHVSPRT